MPKNSRIAEEICFPTVGRRDVLAMLAAGAAMFKARQTLGQPATIGPSPADMACDPIPPELMQPLLFRLVYDLLNDLKLRKRFIRFPESVVDSYGLSDEQKSIFYTMDLNNVRPALQKELSTWNTEFNKYSYEGLCFPYEDEALDPDACDKIMDSSYPSPIPEIRRLRPYKVASGKDTFLTIFGKSFPPVPSLGVEFVPATGTGTIAITGLRLKGTFRSSRLEMKVSSATKGYYTVNVFRTDPISSARIDVGSWFPTDDKCKFEIT